MIGALACAAIALFASAAPASAASAGKQSPSVSLSPAVSGSHQVPRAEVFYMKTRYGTVTYGWRPFRKSDRIPESASGCNIDVCIDVQGDSIFVDDWNTQAYYSGAYVCTYSIFYASGRDIRQGTFVCGGAGVFFTDWPAHKTYANGTELCNKWRNIPGTPCITIKR